MYLIKNGEINKPITARMVSGNIFNLMNNNFTTSKEYFLAGSPLASGDWGKEEQILPYLKTEYVSVV